MTRDYSITKNEGIPATIASLDTYFSRDSRSMENQVPLYYECVWWWILSLMRLPSTLSDLDIALCS